MKTSKKKRMALLTGLVVCLALGVMAEPPTISDVVVRQRWPWSRLVDIEYVMDCDPTQRIDVAVSIHNGVEALSFPLHALSGDLYNVTYGARRIVWDPLKTGYTNAILPEVCAVLEAITPPLYMIVNLTNAVPEIEYVYEADLVTNKWGAWERDYVKTNGVTVVESVIWTGVTNNPVYKTDKLVLRRVPAGSFQMAGTTPVALTKDFYAGVFEVTQRQWERVMGTGTDPSAYNGDTRPVEQVWYNRIRGAPTNAPVINWPATGSTVSPDSFIGKLRSKTGVPDFDLPTEAQREYLCRAGTTTPFSDGNAAAVITTDGGEEADNSGYTNKFLNALGRYKWNGGEGGATAVVGSYRPNAWGLYDTHGNVWEWCLDWYGDTLSDGNDPKGALSGTDRVFRGGSWGSRAKDCASGKRDHYDPAKSYQYVGFRLIRSLQ